MEVLACTSFIPGLAMSELFHTAKTYQSNHRMSETFESGPNIPNSETAYCSAVRGRRHVSYHSPRPTYHGESATLQDSDGLRP